MMPVLDADWERTQGWKQTTTSSPKHMLSPMMYIASSTYHLSDFCREHFPGHDNQICSNVLGFTRNYDEYDNLDKHLGQETQKDEVETPAQDKQQVKEDL